jgi:hypothetical protein
MIAGFLYQKPRNSDEFMALFPPYIRSQILGEESLMFMEEVLKIINDNT